MPSKPEQEIYDFLFTLFGDNEGIVYAPTKGATAKSFIRYFFNWPAQHQDVVQHMLQANKEGKDAWVSPALLKNNNNAETENWLGTQYLFADFDGNAPKEAPAGIPEPTMKIQSSTPGREHWYWRLDRFYSGEKERKIIKELNRSLVYAIDADKGVHNVTRVLRAPGTKHRGSGLLSTTLKHESDKTYSISEFTSVVSPAPSEKIRLKQEERDLPDIIEVLSSGRIKKISPDAHDILNRSREEVNDRSAALYRFAMEMLETTPQPLISDILALLNHLRIKWGKFEAHADPFLETKKVLQQALRDKKQTIQKVDEEKEKGWFTYEEKKQQVEEDNRKWLIQGLLREGGTLLIAGAANVGKSSLAYRAAADIVLRKPFLDQWETGDTERLSKIYYIGWDMDNEDSIDLIDRVLDTLTEPERQVFLSQYVDYTPDTTVQLWKADVQAQYEQWILETRANLVILDALKDTGALADDEKLRSIVDWVKSLTARGISFIVLNHTRKKTQDAKGKYQTGDDNYGSQMINAAFKSGLMIQEVSEGSRTFTVNHFKQRGAPRVKRFRVERDENLIKYVHKGDAPEETVKSSGEGTVSTLFGRVERNMIDDGTSQ